MKRKLIGWATFLSIFMVLSWCFPLRAAVPYKTYVIRPYKDRNVLCDRYTVQKGDFVWELLRRRGRIAEEDFPRFVAILQHINPHIKNIDKIYPGQQILIPLKEMTPGEGPAPADDRVLTIPVIPDILYSTYTVQPGDYLSKIVAAHHGIQMDQIPEGYFSTLKRINPAVKNLNVIHPGQKIRIPELVSQQPAVKEPPAVQSTDEKSPKEPETALPAPEKPMEETPQSTVSLAVKQLGGRLVESGSYYFPVRNRRDMKLDLSAYPMIELEDGRRLILESGKPLPEGAEKVIRSYWKSLTIVRTSPGEDERMVLDKVLRTLYGEKVSTTMDMPAFDDGIQVTLRADWVLLQKEQGEGEPPGYHCITLIAGPGERTSAPLTAYLSGKNIRVSDVLTTADIAEEAGGQDSPVTASEDAKPGQISYASDQARFVAEFARAIGYAYDRNVPVTFQYAGLQINTMMDLVHGHDGMDAVVDFGTLYGGSKSAIEATGLKVLCIKPADHALAIARNFLTTAGISVTEKPVFFGANRSVFKTISLAVPGLLASHPEQGQILVTELKLCSEISSFLGEKEIKVLQIKPQTTGKKPRRTS